MIHDEPPDPLDDRPDLEPGEGGHVVVREDRELVGEVVKVVHEVAKSDPGPVHLGGVGRTDALPEDEDEDEDEEEDEDEDGDEDTKNYHKISKTFFYVQKMSKM